MELAHRLLKRQVKRHLGSSEAIPAEYENLMASVQEAYQQFETDYSTLERALELSSQELREANSGMKAVYERLIQGSLNGVFAFDRNCCFTVWNPAMKKFTSLTNLQALGKCASELLPAPKNEKLVHLLYKALSGSTAHVTERAYINADTGEQGIMDVFLAPLFSEGGSIIGGLGVVNDVTEHKRTEETLRRQHEYLLILQEMALRLSGKEELDGFFEDILHRACQLLETPHAFMTLVEPGTYKFVNRFSTGLFKDMVGPGFLSNEKLVGKVRRTHEPVVVNNYQYLVDLELDFIRDWIAVPLFQGNEIVGVIGAAYTEQRTHTGEAEVALLKQFAQLASIGLVHEALHEANTRLAALATIDPLTNLPNHRAVVGRIEETLAHCHYTQEECAILFLDIDHFKSINDTWGHQAGDAVLREVAQRLKDNARQQDFVGRYGGEEFAFVLPGVDVQGAALTAERLRMSLNTIPCFWETEKGGPVLSIPITASIGVAIYQEHGATREELIEAADQAMYQAKHRGRNRVCVAGEEESQEQAALDEESSPRRDEATGGSVLSALIAAATAHDQDTSDHTLRTVNLARATAERLGCSSDVISLISQAAVLHDIGKIGIPDTILHKEAPLTDEEWAIMRRHPHIGSEILTEAGGVYELLAHIIVAHHERWDGMGYPHKKQEEAIPLGARILSVVDSYDAMISDRPYRKAMSKEAAREELLRCVGSQFDPRVVDAFLQVLGESHITASLIMTA